MKTPTTKTVSLLGPGILLALLFVAGSLAGRVLPIPFPAPALGVALVLLALRLGVMAAATEGPAAHPAQELHTGAGAHRPALHAVRG
ncbi:MAG TPA: hypothetical protein VLS93_05305 [Anaeromyxobacteraceae bacterium]|nr:hypothetical protein [Anaeromyxobacteraceae bacterium]